MALVVSSFMCPTCWELDSSFKSHMHSMNLQPEAKAWESLRILGMVWKVERAGGRNS